MNNRTEKLLADRQNRATEQYLQRCKNHLNQIRVAESAGETYLGRILSIADKLQHLNPSADQWERYWNIVELGQQKLEQLVSTTRVSTAEYCEQPLNSRDLGSGAIV